jgi:hypothetical protein
MRTSDSLDLSIYSLCQLFNCNSHFIQEVHIFVAEFNHLGVLAVRGSHYHVPPAYAAYPMRFNLYCYDATILSTSLYRRHGELVYRLGEYRAIDLELSHRNA